MLDFLSFILACLKRTAKKMRGGWELGKEKKEGANLGLQKCEWI